LTAEAIAKIDKPFAEGKARFTTETRETDEDCIKTLKEVANNVEQIREIDQSLSVVAREVVDELMKTLQLNNRTLRLESCVEDREVIIYPKGFVLTQDDDGNIEPKLLIDLEPALLYAILRKLIPELRDSLEEKKRTDEELLERLIKIRDPLV